MNKGQIATLAALAALAVYVLQLGVSYGSAKTEQEHHAKRLQSIELRYEPLCTDVAVIKSNIATMKEDLQEIKTKLDRLQPAPYFGYTPPEK